LNSVEVMVDEDVSGLFPLEEEQIEKYAVGVLIASEVPDSEINVIFVGNETMSELNINYKDKEGTTDVLSFNLSDEGDGLVEGEVYVCLERAKEQASELGVPYEEEIIRLVTHGLLHLSGRVHDTEAEYESMMADTDKFVKKFFGDKA
jgi:probable rRNA maturation factor